MPSSTRDRVKKRRGTLRGMGPRPSLIRAPGAPRPGLAEECRRQSRIAAAAERDDEDLRAFLDAALQDIVEASSS